MWSPKTIVALTAVSAMAVAAFVTQSARVTTVESDTFNPEQLIASNQNSDTSAHSKPQTALQSRTDPDAPTGQSLATSTLARFDPELAQSDFLENIKDEHRKAKRYLPQNSVFNSESQDPLTQRYAVDERVTLNEEGTLALTVWSDKKYYLSGETIEISAQVQNEEGQRLNTGFTAVLVKENKTVSEIKIEDTDHDGLHRAAFLLSDYVTTPDSGIYKVLIRNTQHKLDDGVTFTLSVPDIQLTGEYQDIVDDKGNLVIEAQVEVTKEDRFYVQASLYSQANRPIGSSQFSGNLKAGKHWIPLFYTGLMLHDAQADGPYVLKQISVAKVTMPMQRGPLVQASYMTEPYRLEVFSKQEFVGN